MYKEKKKANKITPVQVSVCSWSIYLGLQAHRPKPEPFIILPLGINAHLCNTCTVVSL